MSSCSRTFVVRPGRDAIGGLERLKIPILDCAVATTGDQTEAVGELEKPDPQYFPFVPAKGVQQLARLRVPDLDLAIGAARGDPPSVGAEGNGAKAVNGLAAQGQNVRAILDVPNRGYLILRRDNEAVAIGAEGQGAADLADHRPDLDEVGLRASRRVGTKEKG